MALHRILYVSILCVAAASDLELQEDSAVLVQTHLQKEAADWHLGRSSPVKHASDAELKPARKSTKPETHKLETIDPKMPKIPTGWERVDNTLAAAKNKAFGASKRLKMTTAGVRAALDLTRAEVDRLQVYQNKTTTELINKWNGTRHSGKASLVEGTVNEYLDALVMYWTPFKKTMALLKDHTLKAISTVDDDTYTFVDPVEHVKKNFNDAINNVEDYIQAAFTSIRVKGFDAVEPPAGNFTRPEALKFVSKYTERFVRDSDLALVNLQSNLMAIFVEFRQTINKRANATITEGNATINKSELEAFEKVSLAVLDQATALAQDIAAVGRSASDAFVGPKSLQAVYSAAAPAAAGLRLIVSIVAAAFASNWLL